MVLGIFKISGGDTLGSPSWRLGSLKFLVEITLDLHPGVWVLCKFLVEIAGDFHHGVSDLQNSYYLHHGFWDP